MTIHDGIGISPRDRYIKLAQAEMAKFEHLEVEFRKKDREQRAEELGLPGNVTASRRDR